MPFVLRRAAALLAAVALLAAPARGVLACEMESAAPEASTTTMHHEAPVARSGAVAIEHHGAPVSHPNESPAGQPHAPCDHLVGCAPLALADASVQLSEFTATSAPAVPFVNAGAQSPARALEPPPPKS